jgi:hypothetical protein
MQIYSTSQKATSSLIANIRRKCKDAIYVIGNYSMPMIKYQTSARGIGFVRLLRNAVFKVYRIDEYRTLRKDCTSGHCPSCTGGVQFFLKVRDPRPFQRGRRPEVLCHGLLKCDSCPQMWNRDLLAVLNFRTVVK